jgi:hypothetical protein
VTTLPIRGGLAESQRRVRADLQRSHYVLIGGGEDGDARQGVGHAGGLLRGVRGLVGDEGRARGELAGHLGQESLGFSNDVLSSILQVYNRF